MKIRAAILLGISTLALGGVAAGMGIAADHDDARTLKAARSEAGKAGKLLAKSNGEGAIAHAEAAVGFAPQTAAYRTLLGQAYLRAGRFTSAGAAFADALSLDPQDGKAALNLALTQIAQGQWNEARQTLDTHSAVIAPSDRGLAVALAGDPAAGVEILGNAARSPGADAKTRQNLALALALAGQWQMAKTMVAVDLPPLEADKRIVEWAKFAQPRSASDQVATLLGVQPVADSGMPVTLALNAAGSTAVAEQKPIDTFMPGLPGGKQMVEVDVPAPALAGQAPEVAAAPASLDAATLAQVRFAAPREVLQTLPLRTAAVARTPLLVSRTPFKARLASAGTGWTQGKGSYHVQLGAFRSAAVARQGWATISRRAPMLASYLPQGMNASTKAGDLYRLSVGGFSRADAVRLCASWRARGGSCFVRANAGDQLAAWAKAGAQLASR